MRSTGSFSVGRLVMGAFALGTVPSLVALGVFAGSWKGKSGRFFFRLAGAAVIVLGIINFGKGYSFNGLAVLSYNGGDALESASRPPRRRANADDCHVDRSERLFARFVHASRRGTDALDR